MALTPHLSITKEDIYTRITSYDIFKRYCPGFKELGVKFRSEFRTDTEPSCSIVLWGTDLLYRDFGEFESYRAIPYVMRKFSIKYWDALELIWRDFNLSEDEKITERGTEVNVPSMGTNVSWNSNSPRISSFSSNSNNQTIILIKSRKWSRKDKQYWFDRYYITKSTLERFGVIPISHFWINGRMIKADENTYSYEFYWYKGIFRRKIYSPFNKTYRFLNNGGYVVQGEGVLPKKGELLIITKSLKDIMCLSESGYTAISPPSEKTFFTDAYFNKQKSRFDKLVLYFDADQTGIESATTLSNKYSIPFIHNPIGKPKDYSDYIEKYGKQQAELLIKQLLK